MIESGRSVEAIGMQAMDDLNSRHHLKINSGEQASVWIVLDANPSPQESHEPCVVKVARNGKFILDIVRETFFLQEIESCSTAPPLHIPRVLRADGTLGYMVMSEVQGAVLNEQYIRQTFSKEERKLLGEKTGHFINWMATQLMLRDETGKRPNSVPRQSIWEDNSRITMLHNAALELKINKADFPELSTLLRKLIDEYYDWEWTRRHAPETIGPSFIGHYDLRPGNITFRRINGLWQPIGVIDFGNVQTSTWAAEVRHLRRIGQDVSDAALATSALARAIDPELVNFWMAIQAVTACGLAITSSRPLPPLVKETITQFYPSRDWSELDQI